MPKFVFAFHGGGMPRTKEEGERVMAAWDRWYQDMGGRLADPGPRSASQRPSTGGVAETAGPTRFRRELRLRRQHRRRRRVAKGCPILADGGTVEVAPVMEM